MIVPASWLYKCLLLTLLCLLATSCGSTFFAPTSINNNKAFLGSSSSSSLRHPSTASSTTSSIRNMPSRPSCATTTAAIRTTESPTVCCNNNETTAIHHHHHSSTCTTSAVVEAATAAIMLSPRTSSFSSSSYVSRIVAALEECLYQLNVTTETHPDLLMHLEAMALCIHESMSEPTRDYHAIQHVFDVACALNENNPMAVLAALFHDIVYCHVDGGLSTMHCEKLYGVLNKLEGQPSVLKDFGLAFPIVYNNNSSNSNNNSNSNGKDDDPLLHMVETIFGFTTKTQPVTHMQGMNEFLSTVIGVRMLQPFLSKATLAQMACCIEASIPFRPNDPTTGKSCCMEQLYENMAQANKDHQLGLSDDELVRAVQRAADFGNADVCSFYSEDLVLFLDDGWSLLPETNEGLRRQFLSTVQQYQLAVVKMYGFYNFLQPHQIFYRFRNVPAPQVITEREEMAGVNLELGRQYLGAKLMGLSVVSALAELTGGDAPMSLFLGDLPDRREPLDDGDGPSLPPIHVYPEPTKNGERHYNLDVYNVLSKGRRRHVPFDRPQAPVAAYLYHALGGDEIQSILKEIKVHPMSEDTAWALLRRLPRPVVQLVAQNVAMVAVSRTEKILNVLEQL